MEGVCIIPIQIMNGVTLHEKEKLCRQKCNTLTLFHSLPFKSFYSYFPQVHFSGQIHRRRKRGLYSNTYQLTGIQYFAKRFQNEAIKKNFLKTNHFPTQWIHGNSKTSELHTNALCSFNLYHIPTGQ